MGSVKNFHLREASTHPRRPTRAYATTPSFVKSQLRIQVLKTGFGALSPAGETEAVSGR
jgi:hypothetical protein